MKKQNILIGLLFSVAIASAQQIGDGFAFNISDLTQPIKSGMYQINSLNVNPDASSTWQHLFVIRHSNENNNHQLQLSSSYNENDRLFFRKLANTSGQNWYELATRGSNNFVGNQIIAGNVGIGVTNPTNKLDVNGIIHSQEVKVDMQGWSDFVFKKEYKLPTLEEVEKHIAKKGHLENIPSEKEVLKDGINLGEMNAKLLQKIEEMTLYMINQNKKIIDLEKRLGKVENKF